MAGWGSAPWGSSPWGTGEQDTVQTTTVNVVSIDILAADLLQINFSENMRNNAILAAISSYSVVPFNAISAIPVEIREVRLGTDPLKIDSVLLVIAPATVGAVYKITVLGKVVSLNNVGLTINSGRITMRRTKVDSICSTRPTVYDLRPQSIYRTILNAIGIEDDKIGGSQSDGDKIIR